MKISRALGEARGEWLWDRAIRFGMSVFETIAIHHGNPLFLDAHMDRLSRAAAGLMDVSIDALCAEARQVVQECVPEASGVVRVYVCAGEGGPLDPVDTPGGFVIAEECEVLAGPGGGLRAVIDAAPCVPAPGGWKTGNYWQNIRALRAAHATGFSDAVLTGPDGSVISFAMGNLFALSGNRWLTPPPACGARQGVVRGWVLENFPCEESPLTTDDLRSAESVFMTNSRTGISWVSELDGRPLTPGPIPDFAARYARDVLNA